MAYLKDITNCRLSYTDNSDVEADLVADTDTTEMIWVKNITDGEKYSFGGIIMQVYSNIEVKIGTYIKIQDHTEGAGINRYKYEVLTTENKAGITYINVGAPVVFTSAV